MNDATTQQMRALVRYLALGGLALAGLAPGGAALADDGELADIVVTGSRIAGVVPVGSTVITVGREEIDTSGTINTTQLIQQLPQVFNLGVSENSRGQSGGSSNITYGSSINLRGIGPFTTLILLDSHRAVPQGTTGFAVDPSIIPTMALERVEVVADGASAIYGSDAVAGVVNLILRRNFDGVEANVDYGNANSYFERQAGLLAGHKWGTGQFTFAFENGYQSALSGLNRDFYQGNLSASGGGDFRVVQCNPGNIVIGGVSYAIPPGGVTAANRAALLANTTNKCDNLKYADLIPEEDRNSASLTFNQRLTDGIAIYGDAFASQRNFKFRSGFPGSSLTVPKSNAYFVAPPGLTPASETVNYSFVNDYPQGYSDGYSKAYEATVGVSFKLPARWKFDVDYTFGRDHDDSLSHNVANGPALTAALASANPATAFNPFGGGNSAAVINNILIGYSEAPGQSTLQFYEAKLDGPVWALPGGEVRAAFGYEGQKFEVIQSNLAGTIAAPTDVVVHRARNVDSAYGEFFIPLVGDGNSMSLVHSLDLDLAYRYDKYSDVGSTTNPKFGVNWSPVQGLLLRGSYGKSFRAPTISQIYGNTNSLFVQNYQDPTCSCVRQGVARSGGNLNLSPETATTYTFGVDFEPAFLPRSKFSLTYFNVDYKNQVAAYLSDLTILGREAQFAGTGIIVRNPSAALIAQQVAQTGFTGVLPANLTLFVDGRNFNLGESRSAGIDFLGTYRVPTESVGTLTFGLNGTYFTQYNTATTPAAPSIDNLNFIFNPLRFKARASFDWSNGPVDATLFVNYLNSYYNNIVTPAQKVGSYTTADLHLAFALGDAPSGYALKNVTLSFDARNLFDTTPPFVNIAESSNGGGGFDPTLVNPIGRLLSFRIDKKF